MRTTRHAHDSRHHCAESVPGWPCAGARGSLVNGTNVLAVSLHKAASSPAVVRCRTESTETPLDPSAGAQLLFNESPARADGAFTSCFATLG